MMKITKVKNCAASGADLLGFMKHDAGATKALCPQGVFQTNWA